MTINFVNAITKKHFTDMAIRLACLRFKHSTLNLSKEALDRGIEYENTIASFFKWNNKNFDEQRFFDKVLQVTIELENKVKDDRVNRHEVALRDIYNSIS